MPMQCRLANSEDTRKYIRDSKTGPKSLSFGLTKCKVLPGVYVARATEKFPRLLRILHSIRRLWPDPEFKCTSMYLGVDFATKPHVDSNNLPAALTFTAGRFDNGEYGTSTLDGPVKLCTRGRLTLVNVQVEHFTHEFQLSADSDDGQKSHRYVVVMFSRTDPPICYVVQGRMSEWDAIRILVEVALSTSSALYPVLRIACLCFVFLAPFSPGALACSTCSLVAFAPRTPSHYCPMTLPCWL